MFCDICIVKIPYCGKKYFFHKNSMKDIKKINKNDKIMGVHYFILNAERV